MARKRASMREGPLAELFRATEAAQRAQGEQAAAPADEPARRSEPAGRPEAAAQLPLEADERATSTEERSA